MSRDLLIPYRGIVGLPCYDLDTEGDWLACTRRPGHLGRHHAAVPVDDWRGPWIVVAVWGEDVHADARARGREKITALANARLLTVVDLIGDGLDPNEAWRQVEQAAGIEPTC